MDKKLIAAFALGVVAGAIPSVCVCRKRYEKKLNEEVLGIDMAEKSSQKPILDDTEASEDPESVDIPEEVIKDTDEELVKEEEAAQTGSIRNEEIAEEQEEHGNSPYLMKEDDFFDMTENVEDPHIIYLSYWIPNGFFTDENTAKIDNPEEMLGNDIYEACRNSEDEEIFARNPSRDTYYEIYRDPRDFNTTYSPEEDKNESGFYEGIGE